MKIAKPPFGLLALSSVCFVFAGLLALTGASGWGWFLIVGLLTVSCAYTD